MARLPLEDIRIIDFTWVLAGSHATRLLADLGAQVIKVESKAKLDGWRIGFGLLREGVNSPLEEGSGIFQQENRNKTGLCLNVTVPQGKEIFERFVRIGDVVTANLTPRGFVKMGLEWEKLSKINPRIIVVSMPGLGNWGPHSGYKTFGPNLQALSGMTGLTGFPGQQPVGVGTPWADYLAGMTMATAILAAIEYRQDSGKGQFIDISQQEACTSVLGSYLLDWEANKKMRENQGNHHPAGQAVPHSCYKCKGEERWCVISIASGKEWKRFCDVMGNPEFTKDTRFATASGRMNNQDELDKLVEAWTLNYSPEEVTQMMQNAGVSAATVQNVEDVLRSDAHLWERGFLVDLRLPHPERKPPSIVIPGVITKFAEAALAVRHPAPGRLGEDNVRVLKEILGMTQEEIDQAAAGGAFE